MLQVPAAFSISESEVASLIAAGQSVLKQPRFKRCSGLSELIPPRNNPARKRPLAMAGSQVRGLARDRRGHRADCLCTAHGWLPV